MQQWRILSTYLLSIALLIVGSNARYVNQLSSDHQFAADTQDLTTDGEKFPKLHKALKAWNITEPYDIPETYKELWLEALDSVISYLIRHVEANSDYDNDSNALFNDDLTNAGEDDVFTLLSPSDEGKLPNHEEGQENLLMESRSIMKRNPEGELLKILRNLRRRNRAKSLSMEILHTLNQQLLRF
ncbi:uncharacterized protein LOC143451993 [Clavelina lepadiformis]|uniref:Uncharacterized protein n=1 Tax=Clavelina lepadiformis TaxID=159417 RepID=A0ABP0GZD6_CLALP